MTTGIVIAGGWGYDNLGDEAILAGYLEFFRNKVLIEVASVNPVNTQNAQRLPVAVLSESARPSLSGPLLLGGGGYLNGRWIPEIYKKLRRLVRLRGNRGLYAHGIEVRRMDYWHQSRLISRLAMDGRIAVRDDQSSATLASVANVQSCVLPDAIALLYPHLAKYVVDGGWSEGKIVVNLLNIAARGDSDESLVDIRAWDGFVDDLLDALGDKAVMLVGGEGDRHYINTRHPKAALVEPKTVSELISTLAAADGVLSARMHPALISSALNTPTVAIPYCGKVSPTLERIGVSDIILPRLNVEDALVMLAEKTDHSAAWSRASRASEEWLTQLVNGEADPSGAN
jgi:polysaccharide pyruvyl transferase WcaK-like protein